MSADRAAALVVLRHAAGDGPITAATVAEVAPPPADVEATRRAFAALGLEVGPAVGISFSIAGPRELLERLFPDFAAREGSGDSLDLGALPADARERVEAVVSEAPPAFGPGNP